MSVAVNEWHKVRIQDTTLSVQIALRAIQVVNPHQLDNCCCAQGKEIHKVQAVEYFSTSAQAIATVQPVLSKAKLEVQCQKAGVIFKN